MYKEKAQSIATWLSLNEDFIFIGAMIFLGIYIALRMKMINLIYLLDIYVVLTFLFIVWMIIAPHRYYALSYFIVGLFR